MNKLKAGFLSLRDFLAAVWWIALVVGIGFAVAFQFVEPAPPKRIVITTGSESGAYYQFAGRYAAILARNGVALEVRPSAGSRENLQRLENNEVQAAFVQGGLVPPAPEAGTHEAPIQSLGSVFYEPVWVFYRGARKIERLTDLKGRRIAVGQEGSGVRHLALQLLAANGIGAEEALLPLGGMKAVEELQQGRIDAAFFVAAQEAPVVQALLHSPAIRVMSFGQADAYRRRFRFLNKLVMPQGAVDLVREVPPEDVSLLATSANLVVRGDLHPALQVLLLQAAREVHGQAGFFHEAGEFPADKDHAPPLSPAAARFLESGPPFLQRFLPFWLAVLIDRLIVLLVPFVALLIPLVRMAPAIYSWRVKSRIFRVYGELKVLEVDLRQHFEAARLPEYRRRLDAIENEAREMSVPLAFSDLLYTLREHVSFVRQTFVQLEGRYAS